MKIWKILFTILFALWLLSPSGFAAPAEFAAMAAAVGSSLPSP
ncbi:MAG: hypothetical protein ACXVCS_10375 [Bdellovibrionota bacterium]